MLSGNPIAQVLSLLVAGVALIAAVLMGAVVLVVVLAIAVVAAIYFWIRIRWQLRGARRASVSAADARREASARDKRRKAGQGRIIEAESTVIEERDLRD